jgi:hypothetical protein
MEQFVREYWRVSRPMLILRAEGTVECVPVMDLDMMAQVICGHIERVPVAHGCDMWVDEAGRLANLRVNWIGSKLSEDAHGETAFPIMGDCVLVGHDIVGHGLACDMTVVPVDMLRRVLVLSRRMRGCVVAPYATQVLDGMEQPVRASGGKVGTDGR